MTGTPSGTATREPPWDQFDGAPSRAKSGTPPRGFCQIGSTTTAACQYSGAVLPRRLRITGRLKRCCRASMLIQARDRRLQPFGDGSLPNIGLITHALFLSGIPNHLGVVQPPSFTCAATMEGFRPELVPVTP